MKSLARSLPPSAAFQPPSEPAPTGDKRLTIPPAIPPCNTFQIATSDLLWAHSTLEELYSTHAGELDGVDMSVDKKRCLSPARSERIEHKSLVLTIC